MKTFQEWLELPENSHYKSDYNKANDLVKLNYSLMWTEGNLVGRQAVAEIAGIAPLSQREAKEIEVEVDNR